MRDPLLSAAEGENGEFGHLRGAGEAQHRERLAEVVLAYLPVSREYAPWMTAMRSVPLTLRGFNPLALAASAAFPAPRALPHQRPSLEEAMGELPFV